MEDWFNTWNIFHYKNLCVFFYRTCSWSFFYFSSFNAQRRCKQYILQRKLVSAKLSISHSGHVVRPLDHKVFFTRQLLVINLHTLLEIKFVNCGVNPLIFKKGFLYKNISRRRMQNTIQLNTKISITITHTFSDVKLMYKRWSEK